MKKLTSLLLAALMVASLAACGGNTSTGSEAAQPESIAEVEPAAAEPEAEPEQPAEPATGTVTITHEYGETEVAVNPENVLVMDYGILDILDYIGAPIGGVPQSGLPDYLSRYAGDEYLNTGNLKEVDFEAVAEHGADLIIVTGRLSSSYDELSEIAPTIYMPMPQADYMEAMKQNIDTLAAIYPAHADTLTEAYEGLVADAAAVSEKAKDSGLEALIVMANDGSISFFGEGSRYGIIYSDLGFACVSESIEDSTHGAEGSFEYFTEVDPSVIFVIDRSAAIGTEGAQGAATLLDNDLVNATQAAQNDKIVYLDSGIWYTVTGGIHSTQRMIAEVAAVFE